MTSFMPLHAWLGIVVLVVGIPACQALRRRDSSAAKYLYWSVQVSFVVCFVIACIETPLRLTHHVWLSAVTWVWFAMSDQPMRICSCQIAILTKLRPLRNPWMSMVLAWVTVTAAAVTCMGICTDDDDFFNCAAHLGIGGIVVAVGVLCLAWALNVVHFKRLGLWVGIANAIMGPIIVITQHQIGKPWHHQDIEHVTMGIVQLCCGLCSVVAWIVSAPEYRKMTSLVPICLFGAIIGPSMMSHTQDSMFLMQLHTAFGYAAGICAVSGLFIHAFPSIRMPLSFLLIGTGLLFMSANHSAVKLASAYMMVMAYMLITAAIAALTASYFMILFHSWKLPHAASGRAKGHTLVPTQPDPEQP